MSSKVLEKLMWYSMRCEMSESRNCVDGTMKHLSRLDA